MRKLAWRNLMRNKRRTALTVASVTFGLLLLCLLTSFLALLQSTEGASDNRVVVRSAISLATLLPEADQGKLETIEHVVSVSPSNWYGGIYKDERPENFFAQFATNPATLYTTFPEIKLSDAEKQAWAAERSAFIAGKALVDKYGWRIGQQIFLKGTYYPTDLNLTLRGVFTVAGSESQEKVIYFHRKYLEEGIGNIGRVGAFTLRLDSPRAVASVTRAAEKMFENSDFQVRAETEKAFQLSFAEMLGNVRLLFGAIGTAAVFSIFFITANTMAMAARERVTEMAVLKTLGFRGPQVATLVLIEALAVGMLGALLGCGLFALSVPGLAAGLAKVFPVFGTLRMGPRIWATGLAVGLGIGLLSGAVPAFSAARLRIVDALRRVA